MSAVFDNAGPPADAGRSLSLRDDASRVDSALARLQASRARLREALMPAPEPDADAHTARHGGSMPWRRWARRLREALPQGPLTEMLFGVARDWWQRHPWRPVGELLTQEARGQLLPLIRRHPLASLLGAAVLGGGAVLLLRRRWPGLQGPLRAAPWLASGWLARQLAQPALQTALLARLLAWLQQARAADPGPSPPGAAPDAASTARRPVDAFPAPNAAAATAAPTGHEHPPR